MAAPLPLAAGEWLEALLPFLFLLFWVVSQIRNFFRAANQGRPQGPVVVRPGADDERRREIARQVEELIRRAAGEKAPNARGEARPRPPGPARPRRAAAPASVSTRQPAREARAATAVPAAEPARSLGSLGGRGGDVARHVGDAFAHEVGRLEPGAGGRTDAAGGVVAAGPAGSVADIAALLRNPATLRQMLLVREVLDRPVDRW